MFYKCLWDTQKSQQKVWMRFFFPNVLNKYQLLNLKIIKVFEI